jgi:hypothetical protein
VVGRRTDEKRGRGALSGLIHQRVEPVNGYAKKPATKSQKEYGGGVSGLEVVWMERGK